MERSTTKALIEQQGCKRSVGVPPRVTTRRCGWICTDPISYILFLGSSGISGKRRMDRGGTDRQSTTLMKTGTTRDTTDKAPIKKVLPEFQGNAAWKGQRKQTNDGEAGGTSRVLVSRRRGQSRTQRAQPG